jgi:cytochrome c-type biogenesis protein CcmH
VRALATLLLAALPRVALAQAPAEPDPRQVVGEPAAERLSGARLDAEAQRVSSLLRCPSCQGLSVQDSPTDIATQMRGQVKDMLARGFSEEQILSYFERSYGEFVRLQPPLRGINWLVWLAPLLALALGGWVVARTLRPPTPVENAPATEGTAAGAPAAAPATREQLPDDEELARYVRRVRQLAYGWPDGEPPGGA